jgi:hypothetical protein
MTITNCSPFQVRSAQLHSNHLGELSRGPSSFSRKSLSRQSLDSDDSCEAPACSARDAHHHTCEDAYSDGTGAAGVSAFLNSLALLALASLVLGVMSLLLLAALAQEHFTDAGGGDDSSNNNEISKNSVLANHDGITAFVPVLHNGPVPGNKDNHDNSHSNKNGAAKRSIPSDFNRQEDVAMATTRTTSFDKGSQFTTKHQSKEDSINYRLTLNTDQTSKQVHTDQSSLTQFLDRTSNPTAFKDTSSMLQLDGTSKPSRAEASSFKTEFQGDKEAHDLEGYQADPADRPMTPHGYRTAEHDKQFNGHDPDEGDKRSRLAEASRLLEACVAVATLALVMDLSCLLVCCMQCFFAAKLLMLHEGEER